MSPSAPPKSPSRSAALTAATLGFNAGFGGDFGDFGDFGDRFRGIGGFAKFSFSSLAIRSSFVSAGADAARLSFLSAAGLPSPTLKAPDMPSSTRWT